MSGTTDGTGVEVVAALTVSVDGLEATVIADGSVVRVESADPAGILDALAGASLPAGVGRVDGPRALGRVADGLAGAGLQVLLTGPNGPVLTLGEGRRSRVGRLLTGSTHVRPGRWAATRPLVLPRLGRRPVRRAAVVAAAVPLVAVLARRLRRRATGS